jgi:4-amino-4-deoxy-L-arabinose transferase-like glycosyltransferase
MKAIAINNKAFYIGLVLIIGMGAFNFLLFLGDAPLADWDKARHGVSAYEMLQSGNFLINTYEGVPDYWNAKPPLGSLSIAASYKLFGFSKFGLRTPSALVSLVTVLMSTLFAGYRLSRPTGLIAAGIMVTLYNFFPHNVRNGDADALFIMFNTAAIICALSANLKNQRWIYCSFLFLALAFLSKSFHAAPAALIVLILLIWNCGWKRLFTLSNIALSCVCGLLPLLAWVLLRYAL